MTTGMPTFPPPPEHAPTTRRGGLIALALVLLVTLGSLAAWWTSRGTDAASGETGPSVSATTDPEARPPEGTRVRVRVLNTSGVSGLARRATAHLRDYGFDVVDFASGRTDSTAATRIAVHTGHPEWGARIQKALGVGRIETDTDSSRYIDLTVFVGRDWRPPPETFRP